MSFISTVSLKSKAQQKPFKVLPLELGYMRLRQVQNYNMKHNPTKFHAKCSHVVPYHKNC